MKELPVYGGKFALVDDEDFEELSKFKWHMRQGYVQRYDSYSACKVTQMHRQLMSPKETEQVDHINGVRHDNRKENLRCCTRAQNCHNRTKYSRSTSGFKGVTWYKRRNKWGAQIRINGKLKYLGLYDNAADAARAYDGAARELHGAFANINFTD